MRQASLVSAPCASVCHSWVLYAGRVVAFAPRNNLKIPFTFNTHTDTQYPENTMAMQPAEGTLDVVQEVVFRDVVDPLIVRCRLPHLQCPQQLLTLDDRVPTSIPSALRSEAPR